MHDTATRSAVSDALVSFATAPLADPRSRAVAAAGHAISHARAIADAAGDTGREIAALLRSQGSVSTDARVRAWVVGAVLATRTPPSTAIPVLAAVIAASERFKASADEIAAAAAVGIEAAARVLAALDSEEFRARWNVSSAVGVIGASLAVSSLLKLDETRTRHALGIAATQAAGLARNATEPMQAIETGKAAADGLEASLMAKHGFTSAAASIDGRRGLAALMAYGFDPAAITAGLGTHWLWTH